MQYIHMQSCSKFAFAPHDMQDVATMVVAILQQTPQIQLHAVFIAIKAACRGLGLGAYPSLSAP